MQDSDRGKPVPANDSFALARWKLTPRLMKREPDLPDCDSRRLPVLENEGIGSVPERNVPEVGINKSLQTSLPLRVTAS